MRYTLLALLLVLGTIACHYHPGYREPPDDPNDVVARVGHYIGKYIPVIFTLLLVAWLDWRGDV